MCLCRFGNGVCWYMHECVHVMLRVAIYHYTEKAGTFCPPSEIEELFLLFNTSKALDLTVY